MSFPRLSAFTIVADIWVANSVAFSLYFRMSPVMLRSAVLRFENRSSIVGWFKVQASHKLLKGNIKPVFSCMERPFQDDHYVGRPSRQVARLSDFVIFGIEVGTKTMKYLGSFFISTAGKTHWRRID
ncbi:hypothetical protein MPDQ_008091 [Monascus purpureus]|uniref:Uncharacterized protein n=1 Tax=Monascus purpureus TaxID=5098 RepID=A0A507QT28_MONPU|nr:hypothetical protein MPDQ_008091 [Monascus purpureus]